MDECDECFKQTDIKKFENEIKLFKFWYEKKKLKTKEKFDFFYGANANEILIKPQQEMSKATQSTMTVNDQSSRFGESFKQHPHLIQPKPTIATD